MGSLGTNQALALEVIGRARAAGVRTFCLCPGGRNAPLVQALADAAGAGLEVLDFFEERSAAFFALGRARRDRRPAVVVTTSGTASAELLPAMVEAYYSSAPLVAVTADRPRSYRGTGAPQAIEQVGLFGVYARRAIDVDRPGEAWSLAGLNGPAHVNVCFDEPLLAGWQAAEPPALRPGDLLSPGDSDGSGRGAAAGDAAGADLAAALRGCSRPLVLLGGLSRPDDRPAVLAYCQRLGAPVLAESSSQLRTSLGPLLCRGGEAAARRGFERGIFDSVIRIGGIPSWRLWRDLEASWRVPVVSVSRTPFPGLTRGIHFAVHDSQPLGEHLPDVGAFPAAERDELLAVDRDVAARTDCLLAEYPDSEPACVRRLSQAVPDGAFVYLGNSQPIREWNQFAVIEERGWDIGENRGANGIDGQLSTFLGSASAGRENWAIVGDLTALYDLQSPWALRYVPGAVRIVVINNGGGRIFERMFSSPRFQNRHELSFDAVAALWGLDYRRSLPLEGVGPAAVLEVRPDGEQTDRFWKALQAGTRA